jgi:hypothetical protein
MTAHGPSAGEERVIALLETLRGADLPVSPGAVEASVMRRVRALPLPRFQAPPVAWRPFAWAAAAGVSVLGVCATVLVATYWPQLLAIGRSLGTGLWATSRPIAEALIERAGEFAPKASSIAPLFDAGLVGMIRVAVGVVACMVVLTLLFLSREVRERSAAR